VLVFRDSLRMFRDLFLIRWGRTRRAADLDDDGVAG
jgi:hypothetical protein